VSGTADPGFSSALMRMIAAAPGHVGINSLARSNAEQAALYAKDPTIAAKPGSSWHEKGLAADLGFADDNTKRWMHAHAGEYGLFFPMSWEPWHIQPLWTQGRKSNSAGAVADAYTPARQGDPAVSDVQGDPVGKVMGGLLSILGAPAGFETEHTFDDALGTFSSMFAPDQTEPQAGTDVGAMAGTAPSTGKGASVNYQAAYDLLVRNGASPAEAHILAAVAGGESGYNTHAHNPNAATGDDSYGLWQINMLGSMGPARRKSFGIASNEELFNPDTNARAAVSILRNQGLGAWSVYKNGSYRKYLPGSTTAKVQ
jgi:Lysozyme like domain